MVRTITKEGEENTGTVDAPWGGENIHVTGAGEKY